MKARNISPGLMRRFACEKWSCFPEDVFKRERQAAKALIRKDVSFRARGFDIDREAVELSRENAKKAHVDDLIEFRRQDVHYLRLPKEPCILLCNPPYGERLMEKEEAEDIYDVLGQRTPPTPGHSYYFITSHERFENFYGRRADKRRKLYNGMLECQFYMYYKNQLGGDWNGKSRETTGSGRMHP